MCLDDIARHCSQIRFYDHQLQNKHMRKRCLRKHICSSFPHVSVSKDKTNRGKFWACWSHLFQSAWSSGTGGGRGGGDHNKQLEQQQQSDKKRTLYEALVDQSQVTLRCVCPAGDFSDSNLTFRVLNASSTPTNTPQLTSPFLSHSAPCWSSFRTVWHAHYL